MSDLALDLLASLRLEDGRPWGSAATPWQWVTAKTMLDPSSPPYRWESRPRGGSKTTDAAAIVLVSIITTLAPGSRVYCFAADKDQARLLVDALHGLAMRTPELAQHVDLANYRVTSRTGSVVEVLPADASSSWGILPSLVVADEVTQWPSTSNARTLWESVFSALGKVPGARLLCISTSGDPVHWTRRLYEGALVSPLWTVQEVPGPLQWVSTDYLEEQQRMLPESVFRRVHLNQWASAEDRLTSVEDLRACVVLDGPQEPRGGIRYVLGLDLGLKHDKTAAAICHREQGAIALDRMAVWSGSPSRPVDLHVVEEWVAEAASRFNTAEIVADPWQSVGMSQRLRAGGARVREYPFSQQSVGRLAVSLHTSIRDHRLRLFEDAELIDELANVRLKETSPGVLRMDHDPDRHDDRAIALALAAHTLLERPQTGDWSAVHSALCPRCEQRFSAFAERCPHCGEPRQKPELSPTGWASVYQQPAVSPMETFVKSQVPGWFASRRGTWYGGQQ